MPRLSEEREHAVEPAVPAVLLQRRMVERGDEAVAVGEDPLDVERLWDKNQVHHPFSRFAVVGAPVMWVTAAMTDEEAAGKLKHDLDAAYAEALKQADLMRGKR